MSTGHTGTKKDIVPVKQQKPSYWRWLFAWYAPLFSPHIHGTSQTKTYGGQGGHVRPDHQRGQYTPCSLPGTQGRDGHGDNRYALQGLAVFKSGEPPYT